MAIERLACDCRKAKNVANLTLFGSQAATVNASQCTLFTGRSKPMTPCRSRGETKKSAKGKLANASETLLTPGSMPDAKALGPLTQSEGLPLDYSHT